MFKLLDCNNFWSPSGGGVRRYHLEKLDYFKTREDVSYVFVMHDNKTYTEHLTENTIIEHVKVPKVAGNWEYRYLTKRAPLVPILKKHEPNVIEVGSPYFMPRIVNRIVKEQKLKSKVYGFWHADFPITYVGRFLNKVPFNLKSRGEKLAWKYASKHYNKMNGVLVSSTIVMNRMETNGMQNLHFAPLGVNERLFNPDKRNPELINTLKAGDDDRLILFFPHRFSKEKGLHVLLEAYPKLCEKLRVEPTLILAGTGPYENLVKKATDRFDHVHFKGFINSKDEMASYYASADLGFALSEWETFGLSIVEALSSGLPIISSGKGAAREHIENSGAGFIMDNVTSDSLVDLIAKFNSRKDKGGMKNNAREYASNLSWKNVFDRQLEIYNS